MSEICVDTGFLLGLYDLSDQFHEQSKRCFLEYFDSKPNRLVVPWPVLYETISTRFVKNRPAMNMLEADWKRLSQQRRLHLLSDAPFREGVMDECFDDLRKPAGRVRSLSIVDRVIRRVLSDVNIRIDALITFNPGDFLDICKKRNKPILP